MGESGYLYLVSKHAVADDSIIMVSFLLSILCNALLDNSQFTCCVSRPPSRREKGVLQESQVTSMVSFGGEGK